MLTEEECEVRFKHRRRIAKISFRCLSFALPGCLVVALILPETVETFNSLRWLITTFSGVWTSLILGYYVSASYEQGGR